MDDATTAGVEPSGLKTRALLVSVFTIATCGPIYELLAGTIASYLSGLAQLRTAPGRTVR